MGSFPRRAAEIGEKGLWVQPTWIFVLFSGYPGWFVSAFPRVDSQVCVFMIHIGPLYESFLWFAGEHAGLPSTDFCRWKPKFRSFTAPPLKIDRPKRKVISLPTLVSGTCFCLGPENTSKPTDLNILGNDPIWLAHIFWDGWFNHHQGPKALLHSIAVSGSLNRW